MADKTLPIYDTTPSRGGKNLPSYDQTGKPVAAKPGWLVDVLKSLPSSAIKGVLGLAGGPGDIGGLINSGVDWASHKLGTDAAYNRLQAAGENGSPVNRALAVAGRAHLPTSSSLVDAANSVIGHASRALTGTPSQLYDPQTMPGRLTQDVVSSLPAAALMGPGKLATNLLKNAPGAVGSGLGSGTAREVVQRINPNSPYATAAQIAGGVIGGAPVMAAQAFRGLRNPANVAARARQIAGQAIRESSLDPNADTAALASHLANPPAVLPGVKPTTAQVLRTPESKALENRITSVNSKQGIPDLAEPQERYSKGILASGQGENGGQNIPALIGSGIKKPDMAQALGTSPDMQLNASKALHGHLNDVEQGMRNAENDAWSQVDKNASMDGAHILKDLNDHIGDMTVADRRSIPSDVSGSLNELTSRYGQSRYGSSMPVSELQGLRHKTLNDARFAKLNGDNTKAHVLNDLSTKMAGHLNNPDNFLFGDEGGASAWQNAVKATKSRHDAFGNDTLSDLTAKDLQGRPAVAPEGAMDAIMSGKNAAQNIRAIKEVPGIDPNLVDQSVSDWLVGKLTKNGSNPEVTAKQVGNFTADPKVSSVLGEVPSAKSRMGDAALAASQNDEANRLGDVVDKFHKAFEKGPKNLSDFLASNKDDVLASTDPANHSFIEQLHNSADLLKDVKPGQVANSQTLDALNRGNLISHLYGKASGLLGSAGAAAGAGEAAHDVLSAIGLHSPAAALAPIALAARHGLGQLEKGISDVVLGGTREDSLKLLSQAAQDPELAHALMGEDAPNAGTIGQNAAKGVGKLATYEAVRPEDQPQEQKPSMAPMDLENNDIDVPHDALGTEDQGPDVPLDALRPQRASGGAVKDIEHLVERLMRRAHHEKKHATKETEHFLKLPDTTVAKALAITKKAIA